MIFFLYINFKNKSFNGYNSVSSLIKGILKQPQISTFPCSAFVNTVLVPILNNAKKVFFACILCLLLTTPYPNLSFFFFYLWLLIYSMCSHWFDLFCWSIINKYCSKQEQEIFFFRCLQLADLKLPLIYSLIPSHPQWPWGWLAMSPAMDRFHIYLHNLIMSAEDKLLHKLFQPRLYIFICSFIFITPVSYYSAAENMRRIWNWSNVGGGHQQRAVLLESSVSSSSFFLFLSQKCMILKTTNKKLWT